MLVAALLLVFTSGLAATLNALPVYRNYWGGLIYGPAAMATSLLGLFIVLFKWKQAERTEKEVRKSGYKSPLDGIRW